MKKRRNNFHEQTCPHCDAHGVLYADRRLLHIIRKLYGSTKRYCPECHQKWRLRARQKSNFAQEFMVVSLAGVIGFGVFYGVRSSDNPVADYRNKQLQEQMANEDGSNGLLGGDGDNVQYPGPPYLALLEKNSSEVNQALSTYGSKYAGAEPEVQRRMMHRAKEYLTTYEQSSSSEKKKLVESVKQKIREMSS